MVARHFSCSPFKFSNITTKKLIVLNVYEIRPSFYVIAALVISVNRFAVKPSTPAFKCD